ncbi:PIN domain-containing protein [Candidatus Pyrohabitans sp.]
MKDKIKEAEGLIRHIDEKDVDIPALALKLNVPLWTNDRHFSGIRR